MSEGFSFFIIFLIYIVSVILRAARKNKGSSSTAPKTVPAAKKTAPVAPVFAKRRAHRDDDCEYGEINHQYSHASERRVAQLDGYLKAGLIDKKEYAQMLERYTRQDQVYSNYYN